MSEINALFSQHSLQELVGILLLVLFVGQGIWKLLEFYYQKYQQAVGKTIGKQKWEETITNSFTKIGEKIDDLDAKIDKLDEQNKETLAKQEQVDSAINLVQERLQENSRSYLIDAHHKFYYQYGKIDDLNLQSLERRYLYYKTAGGDTFIDRLMDEMRSLPRVSYLVDEKPLKHTGEEKS